MEHRHKQQVQPGVHPRREEEKVQRPPSIPHRPEDARPQVVEHQPRHPGEVDPEVPGRLGKHIRRRGHEPEHAGDHGNPHRREYPAQQQHQQQAGLDRLAHLLLLLGPIELGDHHPNPRRQPQKQADEGVDDGGGGPHRRQGGLAHKIAQHDAVHGVVALLKKIPRQQWQGEEKQGTENAALGHVPVRRFCPGHLPPPPFRPVGMPPL